MSTPEPVHDSGAATEPAEPADWVTTAQVDGVQATHVPRSDATGGQSTEIAHPSASPNHWFSLLRDSVLEMEAEAQTMTAAGVSLWMRRMDPGFSPVAAGFSTFRLFLEAAEADGLVSVQMPEQTGLPDLMVASPGEDATRRGSKAAGPTRVRRDIWDAVMDWAPSRRHGYNRRTRHIVRDLESPASSDLITLPKITKEQQLAWMRDFAASLESSEERAKAEEALATQAPVGAFGHLLRGSSRLSTEWRSRLRTEVLAKIIAWADSHQIARGDLVMKPEQEPSRSPLQSRPGGAMRAEDDLRAELLRTLERLPLAELLKLPIPLEYVLRR
jgi:hypothetical protein